MILIIGKNNNPMNTNKAFTLIEVAIVLVILACMAMLVIPQIGFLTGGDLSDVAAKIGEKVKYAYNKSVIKNKRYRIIFNLDEGNVTVEYAEKLEDIKTEETEEGEEEKKEEEQDDDKKKVVGQDRFVKEEDKILAPYKLPSDIRLSGLYTFHTGKVINEGSDFITILPNGFVEKGIIYLEDGFNRVKTLKIYELTGQMEIYDEYKEPDEIE